MSDSHEQNGTATALVEVPEATPVETTTDSATNRPCKSFSCSIAAGVYAEVSIWPKEIEIDGRKMTVYSCTARKSYKTDEGWKNTQFYRGAELFIIRHLLEQAEKWILAQRTQAEPEDLPF